MARHRRMVSRRLVQRLAVLMLGAGALLVAAPGVAYANSVTVSPPTVKPGERITVRVVCKGAGTAKVKVFWGQDVHRPKDTRELKLRSGSGSTTFRIPEQTDPSRYLAGTFCPSASKATTARFTVAPRGAPHAGVGPGPDRGSAVLVAGAAVLAAPTAGLFVLRRRGTGPAG